MTQEERNGIISNIAQAVCEDFSLGWSRWLIGQRAARITFKQHLRALYASTVDKLEASSDDYIKEQADFYGVKIETSTGE